MSASIDLTIAVPVAGALAGAVGWMARQYIAERAAREKSEDKLTDELRMANAAIVAEKDARIAEARKLGEAIGESSAALRAIRQQYEAALEERDAKEGKK